MSEATTRPRPCQVRIKTESPCPRRAVVEILGVAFCAPCARQQEIYFSIGELTQVETKGLHSKSLTEVLERKWRGRAGSKRGERSADESRALGRTRPRAPLGWELLTPPTVRGRVQEFGTSICF